VNAYSSSDTENDNIAIGYEAMTTNTAGGNNNVVLGNYAGNDITSGDHNVLFGNNSGEKITTGGSNTAIGSGSLAVMDDASECVAMGTSTLGSGQAGANNTALGWRAGYVVTGESNTLVGHKAGYANTSGYDNTFVGQMAGNTTVDGFNNSAIGHDAVISATGTDNEFVLGNGGTAALRCNDQSIAALSDARDKKDIIDLPHGLDFINQTRPVQFVWDRRNPHKYDTSTGKTNYGFIAQELLEIGNNEEHRLVYESNPDKLEARYGNLMPILVKAVQELSTKNDSLETSNQALIARIEALENA